MQATSFRDSQGERHIEVRVARGLDDLLMAFAVRAAVFLAEQMCPYREEFDGNDLCAAHVLATVDGEPAGTLRLRFFGEFAKLERVAVRREYRDGPVARALVSFAIQFLRTKGYVHVVGNARRGLERLWHHDTRTYGGFVPVPGAPAVSFSGLEFTPMELFMERDPDHLSSDSPAELLNRPEGVWDRPGPLESPDADFGADDEHEAPRPANP
jgi:predicted GNAT family N-acyltransferase